MQHRPSTRRRRAAGNASVALIVVLTVLAGCARPAPPAAPDLAIDGARAPNQSTVVVTFNRRVGVDAANPTNYAITEPGGAPLGVMAAYPDPDGVTVRLATEPQQLVTYGLAVSGVAAAGGGPTAAALTANGGFAGSARAAPMLQSAVALTNRRVLLTFYDPETGGPAAMGVGADDPAHYAIAAPDLDVLGAVFADDGADTGHVLLTVAPMADTRYRVSLENARVDGGDALLDPFLASAEFRGMTDPDTAAPDVVGATALDATTVRVTFSEPMGAAAGDPSHYLLTDADGRELKATDATVGPFGTAVTLTTWAMTGGVAYTVTVTGVPDAHGNALATTTAAITAPTAGTGDDTTPPRVLSASAPDPTTVVVTFSEPVAGGAYSAENPDHYSIVDAGAGAMAAQALLVVREARLSANQRTVTLTTMAQSEIDYALTVTDVKDLAGNQVVPPDRTNPYQVTFAGSGASGTPVDSDGDGLSDAAEQLGWTVSVTAADGTVTTRSVTSDPGDPGLPPTDPVNVAARDTDQDGEPDGNEKTYGTDPRSADTDGDQLTDEAELERVYSDPTMQDTDGDGLADGLEFDTFHTSPLFADTDGDGLTDDYEIATSNRNPRIADLPRPQIKIGSVDLALDVRFETQTQQGENAVDSKSSSVTLEQDQSRTFSTTDTQTNEWFFKAGAKVGFETEFDFFGIFNGATVNGEFSTEGGASGSSTFEVSNQTASSSSRAYADTLSTEKSYSREETLTRRVDGAQIGVLVDVENLGNISFTMTDLEITALVKDPRDPRILTPIATLFPADPSLAINLGPLDSTSRGPFRFVANDAFPSRVEDLMSNPRGIVFKVANFTIRDQEGRSFSFGEQVANDRTAPLVIDYGAKAVATGRSAAVERYRVATNAGFDASGNPTGITVREALEDIVGLTHYDEVADPSASLTSAELSSSYSSYTAPDGRDVIWRIRDAMPDVPLGVVLAGTTLHEGWGVLQATGIDATISPRDFVLQPEHGMTLAYMQDLDQDRVPARVELYYGSSDDPAAVTDATDSDGDHVAAPASSNPNLAYSDNFEIYGGWSVRVNRAVGDAIDEDVFDVRSSPARADTDADGLSDWEEMHGCLDRSPADQVCDTGSGFGISISGTGVVTHTPDPTDPTRADTDGDRILDADEVLGFEVTPANGPAAFVRTDPTDVDTDNDGIADQDEIVFGGNPALDDVDSFTDTDGDGLLNQEELDGWTVTYRRASTVDGTPGPLVTCTPTSYAACVDDSGTPQPPTSDPGVGSIDTDGDGLTDREERDLGTHPRLVDTDGDGISDYDEVKGTHVLPFDGDPRVTDPIDADTDHDRLTDGEELLDGWAVTLDGVSTRVYSDPTAADLDGEQLHDFDERAAGTDPNVPDTDGDDSTDKVEVDRGNDADANNDTDPLVPDLVLQLTYDLRGVRTSFNNICGEAGGGSAYVTGDLDYRINQTDVHHPFDSGAKNIGTSYVNAYTEHRVFTAVPGEGVTADGTNLKRWDGGVSYDLESFNKAFTPTSGDLFTAVVSEEFRQTQTAGNPEDCVIQFRFTITPQP